MLGAGYSLPVPSRFASRKANVIVVLGADAPGKPALSPPHKPVVKLPGDMVRTTDYRAAFAAAAHRAHLPGLYPSAVFGTSEQCSDQPYPSYQPNGFCEFSAAQPVRAYHLNASSAGGGRQLDLRLLPDHAGRLLGDRGDPLHRRSDLAESERDADT